MTYWKIMNLIVCHCWIGIKISENVDIFHSENRSKNYCWWTKKKYIFFNFGKIHERSETSRSSVVCSERQTNTVQKDEQIHFVHELGRTDIWNSDKFFVQLCPLTPLTMAHSIGCIIVLAVNNARLFTMFQTFLFVIESIRFLFLLLDTKMYDIFNGILCYSWTWLKISVLGLY